MTHTHINTYTDTQTHTHNASRARLYTDMQLFQVSSTLTKARMLQVAVPGTYRANQTASVHTSCLMTVSTRVHARVCELQVWIVCRCFVVAPICMRIIMRASGGVLSLSFAIAIVTRPGLLWRAGGQDCRVRFPGIHVNGKTLRVIPSDHARPDHHRCLNPKHRSSIARALSSL